MPFRLIAHGFALLTVLALAQTAHAQEFVEATDAAPSPSAVDVLANVVPTNVGMAADRFGMNAVDLWGAVNTLSEETGKPVDPLMYLCGVGEIPCPKEVLAQLAPPAPPVAQVSRAAPAITGAVARAQCIISEESGGADVMNRRGSGATGPGQYMPSTWANDSAAYRAATGYTGSLSIHSYADVERVMAWTLSVHPGKRTQWTVSGC